MADGEPPKMTAEVALKQVSAARDFYEVLGVEQKSDSVTIRKAYRKIAMLLHPDKNPGDAAKDAFQKVGEAMGTLSDDAKRKKYDTALRVGAKRWKPMSSQQQAQSQAMQAAMAAAASQQRANAAQQAQAHWAAQAQAAHKAGAVGSGKVCVQRLQCPSCRSSLEVDLSAHRVGAEVVIKCPKCSGTVRTNVLPHTAEQVRPARRCCDARPVIMRFAMRARI